MRIKLACSLICASGALALSGCNAARYLAYLTAPAGGKQKVLAEFEGLAGHTVAVVIYADQSVQYDYPYARLGLSMAIASELRQHVKDIRVIAPQRVVAYQDQSSDWESMNRVNLGRSLGADYLVYLPLDEYSMREPGSISLFRGRIRGQALVYDCAKPERDAKVWQADELSVIYPPQAPAGEISQDDSRVKYQTEKLFADLLAKKFYTHEVPRFE